MAEVTPRIKHPLVAAGAVLAIGLTGCSSGSGSGAATAAPAPAATYTEHQQFFLDFMRTLPNVKPATRDWELFAAGERACVALDTGADAMSVASAGMASGLSPQQSGLVLGHAVYSLCPDNQPSMHWVSTKIRKSDFLHWKRTGETVKFETTPRRP